MCVNSAMLFSTGVSVSTCDGQQTGLLIGGVCSHLCSVRETGIVDKLMVSSTAINYFCVLYLCTVGQVLHNL